MTWNTFGRSVLFAALAAAAWVPWLVVVGPLLGANAARQLYLILAIVLYVSGLSRNRSRSLIVAGCAGGVAVVAALVARNPTELGLGLGLTLGIARSAFLYRNSTARAVTIEGVLQLGGLLLARWLSAPPLAATSTALWGYLLVQSFFFLIAADEGLPTGLQAERDPFEAAHRAALALLDE